MSWNVMFIGNPENIVVALEKESENLNGQSKTEFDAALPHLVSLVKQNYNNSIAPVLSLTASGHGYDTSRTCVCKIEYLSGTLV